MEYIAQAVALKYVIGSLQGAVSSQFKCDLQKC